MPTAASMMQPMLRVGIPQSIKMDQQLQKYLTTAAANNNKLKSSKHL